MNPIVLRYHCECGYEADVNTASPAFDPARVLCSMCNRLTHPVPRVLPRPVCRKLTSDTRAGIIEAIRVNGGPALKDEEPYVHALAYYVFSLLENQWPSFWEDK